MNSHTTRTLVGTHRIGKEDFVVMLRQLFADASVKVHVDPLRKALAPHISKQFNDAITGDISCLSSTPLHCIRSAASRKAVAREEARRCAAALSTAQPITNVIFIQPTGQMFAKSSLVRCQKKKDIGGNHPQKPGLYECN
jgi:hypothetical protein